MGITRNQIFGNTVNNLPCTLRHAQCIAVNQSENPNDGGEAVFIARSLLDLYVDDQWQTAIKTQSTIGTINPIETAQKDETVKVYPNPVNSQLTVEFVNISSEESSELNNNKFTLYNMMGVIVYTINLKSSINNVDMSAFSNGIYFYEIKDANEKALSIEKLIINH